MSTAGASVAVVNHKIVNLNRRKSTLLSSSSSSFISTKCPPYRYYGSHKRNSHYSPTAFKFKRPFSSVMEWQDCTVKMEVGVPTSVAYKCYADREAIPQWMPFIRMNLVIAERYSIYISTYHQKERSIRCLFVILEDKPDLSRWSLKYQAFGRDIEFSWLARNMQPIPNQKIHWRSLEGLPNRKRSKPYARASHQIAQTLMPLVLKQDETHP